MGRVSKELLLHAFDEVDLLEPSQHLLAAAGVCLCVRGRCWLLQGGLEERGGEGRTALSLGFVRVHIVL